MVWFADDIFAAESPVMTRLQCCGWCGVALVAGYITPAQNGAQTQSTRAAIRPNM